MLNIILTLAFIFSISSSSIAHPPQEMGLSYDSANQVLIVQAKHVITEPDEHFIRKLMVYVNDTESTVKQNRRQVDPQTYETEIPLAAKAGDVVLVKAYCSEGGTKEASIVIPEEEKSNEVKEESIPAQQPADVSPADSPSVYP